LPGGKIRSSILFLGTGTGPAVVGKGLRSSGGILINLGDNQLHIDPGIGAVIKAGEYGANLRENTAILISHAHLSHAHDVNAVIDAMTYSGLDKKGVLIANKTCMNGTEDYAPIVSNYYRSLLERFITVDRGQRIGINDIEIQTITARHSEPNSIGFKIFAPSLVITYSGDTVYAEDIVQQYMDSNILILNVPFLKKSENNLCMSDAISIIQRVQPKLAILTHFGHEMIKADPLYEVRDVQKQTKVQTLAAKDGMIINPVSFEGRMQNQPAETKKSTSITVKEDNIPSVANFGFDEVR
jgi:ribonuclease BN (tRNA processing enzyme)